MTASEQAAVTSAIKGDFKLETVSEQLRVSWSDDLIKEHDKKTSAFANVAWTDTDDYEEHGGKPTSETTSVKKGTAKVGAKRSRKT